MRRRCARGRVSHAYHIAADPGAALLAGLTALPKATALTTCSCRLEHRRQAAFLAALDKAAIAAGLADGEALNLDFHAVMHWGKDPVLEKHYVPRRSQRTRSVLTFFAEDASTHTRLYANADLSKASQNRDVILPARAWMSMTLGRAGNNTRRVPVHDDPAAQLPACPCPIRQPPSPAWATTSPPLPITNRPALPARQVIQS